MKQVNMKQSVLNLFQQTHAITEYLFDRVFCVIGKEDNECARLFPCLVCFFNYFMAMYKLL